MADDTNTNPFLCDDDDLIENEIEEHVEAKQIHGELTEITLDSIAAKLLKDKLYLTALELHSELVETGRELPRLRDYFSNPGNFERTKEDSPPSNLPRTSSIQTFDSLDFARYSDDGERQVDERVAVLEFELRKAQDTIKSLRRSLTKEAETEHVSPDQVDDGKSYPEDSIKPLEKKALNFLVNQYLLQINNKLTSVTFSEENEEQDFESWDDVGLNIAQPPDLLHLYRDYSSHVMPTSDHCEGGCQTELEIHDINSLEGELESVKIELEKRILELEQQLLNKDKEMLIRRGVAEGSEADDPSHGYPFENKSRNESVPFHYSADNQSNDSEDDDENSDEDEEDDDLDIESECHCDHANNETCPVCVRVQSPEVYRIDFTEMPGEHSGDQDSGSFNSEPSGVRTESKDGCENTSENVIDDKTHVTSQSAGSDDTDGSKTADTIVSSATSSNVGEKHAETPQIIINNVIQNQNSDELNSEAIKNAKNIPEHKRTKESVKKDPKSVRRKERTPKHSKRKEKSLAEGEKNGLIPDEKDKVVETQIEDLCQTNRKMSKTFMKALKDVCFYITKDNRIVSEVSKISDADQQKVVLMLGRCLPHIVPNVLLAKREELIPLIICTAMLHPEAKERDNLLNILFNLIKKPDDEQRQIILTGCVAFAEHVGPRRLEEELLPQCWEQINHKYMERRLLVAEACGALAAYLPNEIRSSLVLSMLQQMLHDDKEPEVREAVVRSLGLLMGFISDPDKYQQGCDLLKTALRDNSERVVTSAQQILLPSFAVWAYELGRLEHSLLHTVLHDLEELVKDVPISATAIASQKTTTLNEGRYLLYVTTLTELISFLYISVIESGPYQDKVDALSSKTDELLASRFPTPSSTLTDLVTITGDKQHLAALINLFEDHISQDWFEPWDSLNWVVNNLIPRLLEVVMGSALSFPRIVSSLAKCFFKICHMFGKTFVDKKVKPRFIDVLLMEEEHMDPHSNFTTNTTPLTTCVVPVYASGVLSAFNTEEDRKQLSQFLREALFCLSIYQSPKDSLRIAVTELCSSSSNHELLLNVLWEGVVHTSAQVRATAARMFEIVMHGISEVLASTRVVPALVTLGNDPEITVRIATIPALGTIIESISSREMLDRVYMQLQTFLDDPVYREEHSLHVELIATFARVGPNAEPKYRDEWRCREKSLLPTVRAQLEPCNICAMPPLNNHAKEYSGVRALIFGLSLSLHRYFVYARREDSDKTAVILPRLTTLAIENNNQTNEVKKKEIALQLFEAYSALSCCFVNYQLVQEVMLPGLRCLKHDMALIAPEHEEVVNSMIKEYESKIETSRPADRSSSLTGSFSSLASGEDVKARMMNKLKESTSKANISSLFNRKK